MTRIRDFIDASWPSEVEFLKSLVRVSSDNPPGDCAPHAEVAAAGLEGLGLVVERHPVPEALARQNGMVSPTNLIVRRSFGTGRGPVIYAISAGFSYAITVAHNGCLHLEVTIRGRQAHAAMPATGGGTRARRDL